MYKEALTADSPLLDYLTKMSEWIDSWRIVNGKGEDTTNSFR